MHCHIVQSPLTELHSGPWVVCHSCYVMADFSDEIQSVLSPHSGEILLLLLLSLSTSNITVVTCVIMCSLLRYYWLLVGGLRTINDYKHNTGA